MDTDDQGDNSAAPNRRNILLAGTGLVAACLLCASGTAGLAQQTTGAPGSPSATTTIDGRYLPAIIQTRILQRIRSFRITDPTVVAGTSPGTTAVRVRSTEQAASKVEVAGTSLATTGQEMALVLVQYD